MNGERPPEAAGPGAPRAAAAAPRRTRAGPGATAIIGSTVGVVVVVGASWRRSALLRGGGDSKTDASRDGAALGSGRTGGALGLGRRAAGRGRTTAKTGTCDYVAEKGGGVVKDVGCRRRR